MIILTKDEMRRMICDYFHKDTSLWYRILGEMFEATIEFRQYGVIDIRIDKKKYCIEWFNNQWTITLKG